MVVRRVRGGGRPLTASWELAAALVAVLLCALCGGGGAAPWNQDEDLAALGSLDSLLAYEDLRQAVQQAEDAWGPQAAAAPGAQGAAPGGAKSAAAWQPAEPDPQLYLLTEYDRGGQGQTRVKRNREAVAAAAAAGRIAARNPSGLRRHARNPSSSSSQRLSIVNPLDVLRQRLLLEIARRRKASVPQSNREMLEGIGKRSSWSPKVPVEQQVERLERCLAELGELGGAGPAAGAGAAAAAAKAEDRLARLTLLYRAIEYGDKCDITSDLGDQDQRQPQQHQHLPSGAHPQEQGETNHIRDEQDDWSARHQANGWMVLVLIFLPQDPCPILYDRILRLAFVFPDGINPLALFLYFCGVACGNGDATL
ncbi:Diuretic hormone [Frankliniella fusca]|uniref:Diuretic hormone n=1 Tax=Frankliniella fusca TaxID=407009 RepID=A0AAE1GRW5_9NEOP|nr:Diuretic hormone [Frankliniella fusca]